MSNLSKIQEHFEVEYPKEACGILGVVKGKEVWYPCTNVAEDPYNNFVLDSSEYLKIKRSVDITAIVHSHPDAESTPSASDIDNCNALGIPYHIYSYPEMEVTVVKPKDKEEALSGREYKFGVLDCFEAARDYYKSIGISLPKRDAYEDDWWLKGKNYFNKEYINSWGFYEVQEPKKNDLIVLSVNSEVGNHCGVYLGNDVFFHHAVNRLSCKENLYPFWVKYITGIYRYDA